MTHGARMQKGMERNGSGGMVRCESLDWKGALTKSDQTTFAKIRTPLWPVQEVLRVPLRNAPPRTRITSAVKQPGETWIHKTSNRFNPIWRNAPVSLVSREEHSDPRQ